jgi:UbiD family decarboxylase
MRVTDMNEGQRPCKPLNDYYLFTLAPTLKRLLLLDPYMAFRDHLQKAEHITSVDPIGGMKEVALERRGKTLVFDEVEGAPGHRAAMNVCIRRNLATNFDIAESEVIDILGWAMGNGSIPISAVGPAPVFENSIEPADLHQLPIPHHWREDRGRYMSASIIIAEWGGNRNVSYHRQFIRDSNHVVARLVPRHLRTMVDEARAAGQTISIGIVNGADPSVLLAAAMSFNEPIDELSVAAALHERLYGKPLELVKLSNGIEVPADAEYAMAATITLEDDDEGPYVDITGTVDDVRQEPLIEVHSIHHRNNPVFHAILPAGSEHRALMGLPRAPTIKAAVSKVCKCTDVVMTEGGSGWLSAVVQIEIETADEAKAAIMAAFAGHPSMKAVTVVDTDIDPADPIRVEWALMTRWQPDKDTVILTNQRGSSLDPTRTDDGLTSKIGYDATIPFGSDKAPFTSVT